MHQFGFTAETVYDSAISASFTLGNNEISVDMDPDMLDPYEDEYDYVIEELVDTKVNYELWCQGNSCIEATCC